MKKTWLNLPSHEGTGLFIWNRCRISPYSYDHFYRDLVHGYDPYTLEPVFSARLRKRSLPSACSSWYKPEERRAIESELRRIGRADLIDKLYDWEEHGWQFQGEEDAL